jgi:hypothetical protein
MKSRMGRTRGKSVRRKDSEESVLKVSQKEKVSWKPKKEMVRRC